MQCILGNHCKLVSVRFVYTLERGALCACLMALEIWLPGCYRLQLFQHVAAVLKSINSDKIQHPDIAMLFAATRA